MKNLNFSFDWEDRNDAFAGGEAEHGVFLYISKLQKPPVETR